ncbi:MAG TPA: hypothetical protein DDZ84_11640 [Firmicutes bacterium]|nr:hypothetical protein [Bacillota bacterium]
MNRMALVDADFEEASGIALIAGPEGGFSHCEVELAKRYGALTAATVIMYELGEFGQSQWVGSS